MSRELDLKNLVQSWLQKAAARFVRLEMFQKNEFWKGKTWHILG